VRSGQPVDGRHARGAAPGPGATSINARALAFVRHVIVRTSERTESFAWGTACFNDRYRLRWDSNLLLVERRLVGVDADSLAREADLLLAPFAHRNLIVFDDADGMRVADGLARLGYERDHLVVMALAENARRGPEGDRGRGGGSGHGTPPARGGQTDGATPERARRRRRCSPISAAFS
jgi:hypothetical protein